MTLSGLRAAVLDKLAKEAYFKDWKCYYEAHLFDEGKMNKRIERAVDLALLAAAKEVDKTICERLKLESKKKYSLTTAGIVGWVLISTKAEIEKRLVVGLPEEEEGKRK